MTEKDIEKLKKYLGFEITYFAEKHGKVIKRMGIWQDDKCRVFRSAKDELCFTYWDMDKKGYRTAKDIEEIIGYLPKELESLVRH
tara:strand:+ start:911 stop:1165 length:255 start_codon:yes stop_codon:yes gene_type:complete